MVKLLKGDKTSFNTKMAIVKIKGHDIHTIIVRDSSTRRAQQYKNLIISKLKKIGVPEDDVDLDLEKVPTRKAPASVAWYFADRYLFYSYNSASKYIENLYVVLKVIEAEVDSLLHEEESVEDFIHNFSENKDVIKQRKEAREILGVDEDCIDLDLINKQYKKLAREFHPDMPNGSEVMFKKINHAHKLLQKELS